MSSLRARAFSQILTFTRASTGTYYGEDGAVAVAAVNEPRFEYDPVTRQPRGLLVEEARTNLLLQSADFTTTWVNTRTTDAANSAAAPDGTTSADSVIEDSSSNTHYIAQTVVVASAAADYAFSVSLKAGTRSHALIAMAESVAGQTCYVAVNLTTGALGTASVGGANWTDPRAFAESQGDGWYRVTIVGRKLSAATALTAELYVSDAMGSINYTGNGSSLIYAWGAQLEAGPYVTSYIPTTTSAATRAADVCGVSSLSPWFAEAEGTIFAEYMVPWTYVNTDTTSRRIVQVDNASDVERHIVFISGTNRVGLTTSASIAQAQISGAAAAAGVVQRHAYAWRENDIAGAFSGGQFGSDASAVMPSGLTNFRIGSGPENTQQPIAYIRKVRFYPRRLSDNELRSLVA